MSAQDDRDDDGSQRSRVSHRIDRGKAPEIGASWRKGDVGYSHDHNPHRKHSQLSINGQTSAGCSAAVAVSAEGKIKCLY